MDKYPQTRFERRKQKTHNQLRDAITELLIEGGYAELTVQKIVDRADVGYGTFYLHYHDKDDAVWDVVHAIMMETLAQTTNAVMAIEPHARELVSWTWLFEYLAERRPEYNSLFGASGSAELRRRYQEYMTWSYEKGMNSEVYDARVDLPRDFMTQFMAGATIQLLLWWMEKNPSYTARQMAEMLYLMVYRQPPPAIDIPQNPLERGAGLNNV